MKISRGQFDKHINKEYPQFNPTKDFDYVTLNKKISDIIHLNNLGASSPTNFITYFKDKVNQCRNGATKKTYMIAVNKMESYYPDGLEFANVNNNVLLNIKHQLYQEGHSDGYVAANIGIIVNYINLANDDWNVGIVINVKKLKLKKNTKRRDNLLTDDDVDKLLDYEYDIANNNIVNERYFQYISFGLIQLFSGSRFSDICFMKNGDFKKDGIEIQLIKTKQYKKIPYSIMLIKTIYKYVFKDEDFTKLRLTRLDTLQFYDDERFLGPLRDDIILKLKDKPKTDFFFEWVPDSLKNYDISKPFNDEQARLYGNLRSKYNHYLKVFSRQKSFDSPISSHSFRYKFVSNMLEQNVSVYKISKMLNHSSLLTTETYIKNHFDLSDTIEDHNISDAKYVYRKKEQNID
jgi:integrase